MALAQEVLDKLKARHDVFVQDHPALLERRREQINEFVPIAKRLLVAVLGRPDLTAAHLSSLIAVLSASASSNLLLERIPSLVVDNDEKDAILGALAETDHRGLTRMAKSSVGPRVAREVAAIRAFVLGAQGLKTSTEAAEHVRRFDQRRIPEFKSGVYSPWLYYMRPDLFPIANGAVNGSLEEIGAPTSYPQLVEALHELLGAIGEHDAGILDRILYANNEEASLAVIKDLRKIKWLKEIRREHWELFLDASKRLLMDIGIGPDDKRLVFNVRDDAEKRIHLTLGKRLHLGIGLDGGQRILILLKPGARQRYPNIPLQSVPYEPFKDPPCEHWWLSLAEAPRWLHELQQELTECALENQKGDTSNYRKHHVHDLYRLAMEPDFRRQALDYLLKGTGAWPGRISSDERTQAAVIHAYLLEGKDQRTIERDIMGLYADGTGIGREAGRVLSTFDIGESKKRALVGNSFSSEYATASVKYKRGLDLLVKYYPHLKQGSSEPRAMELNTILYGPPGTGKTYDAIAYAVAIIDGRTVDETRALGRAKVREKFKAYLSTNQVRMATFHQSFSYEDFIGGIKPQLVQEEYASDTEETEVSVAPDLQYEFSPGQFMRLCTSARAAKRLREKEGTSTPVISGVDDMNLTFWKVALGASNDEAEDEIYDYCMDKEVIAVGYGGQLDCRQATTYKALREVLEKNGLQKRDGRVEATLTCLNYLRLVMKEGDVVFVSSGNSLVKAIGVVSGEYFMDKDASIRYKQFRKVKWLYKDLELPVQDFYFKDFKMGTLYRLKPEKIKREYFQARSGGTPNTEADRFVMIIDEINRGNVAGIFGELITLIESDKREGAKEEAVVDLPYTKQPFSVPDNIYLVGTMNTADRSVEALDTALRRRFSFVECPSAPEELKNEKVKGVDLTALLTKLNARIEMLLDRDHHIGHSYFMNWPETDKDGKEKPMSDDEKEVKLRAVFKKNIIPLLQEYFYGDPVKVGMVLGAGFVEMRPEKEVAFAGDFKFEDIDAKPRYEFIDPTSMKDEKYVVPIEAFERLAKGE
ncbi:MAG: AAA family ATPase [Flavobacteriales bacterium]